MKDYMSAAERMAWPRKRLVNNDLMWTIVCLGIFVLYVCLTN
jgi:hypothetical protein